METNFNPFPILTTERLVLRQLAFTDEEDIFIHRSDNIVNTYLDDFRHDSREDTRAFISRVLQEIAMERTILWVITHKGNNRFIGTVCFWNILKEEGRAETGYTLDSRFHRLGYMNEALAAIIDFGFHTMKLKLIEAYTHEHNTNSIQLLQRNKFKQGLPQKPVGSNRIYFSRTSDIL